MSSLEVEGYGETSLLQIPVQTAVFRFRPESVYTVYRHPDVLHGDAGVSDLELDDGMEGDLHVGKVGHGSSQQYCHQTPNCCLMRYDQQIIFGLQLIEYWSQSLYYVHVTLALWVSVVELVLVSASEFNGELLRDVLVGHVVVFPGVDFIQFRANLLWSVDELCCFLGPAQSGNINLVACFGKAVDEAC